MPGKNVNLVAKQASDNKTQFQTS